jgi:hypothetical protein
LEELAHTDIEEMIRVLDSDPRIAEWQKIGKREALRRRSAVWSPRRKTCSTFCIVHSDGTPTQSHEEAAALLQAHWAPVFKAPTFDEDASAALLPFVRPIPEGFDWDITFKDFSSILHHLPDSAPGPDGIPYSAWGRADDKILQLLFEFYCDILNGKVLPKGFNTGNIVFIPKGELEADDAQIRRSPEATRPICLSNTDNKLLAALLNDKLSTLAAATVHSQQRGFVRGRSLVDNIMEIEAMAIHVHKYYREASGIALFDFTAAFPSLSHKWLFAVLRAMGIPNNILAVLAQLYTGCVMNIVFGVVQGFSFEVQAGIKQGCPASGSLFALALDPFLRMMLQTLPVKLTVAVAFADDLAAVLLHLHRGLRLLYPLFTLLFKATGLAINPKKTVIVPLGSSSPFSIKRFLHDAIPAWAAITVDDCGKLLGVWVGPGAAARRWRDATDKFSARARDSKATHFAFEETIRHYKVHAFPVLAHLCQVSTAPAATLSAEDKALQGLTRGPHGVFPQGTLATLKSLGFRFEAPDLTITNKAAMLRTAVCSSMFQKILAVWDTDVADDAALLAPRTEPWFAESCIAGMIANYRTHTSLLASISDFRARGLQAALIVELRAAFPISWSSLLLRRLWRWLPELPPVAAQLALRRFQAGCGMLPGFVAFAWLRGILNGMPSASRSAQEHAPCLCCNQCSDRLEHLVHCTAFVQLIAEHFPLLHRAQGPVLRWDFLTLTLPIMRPRAVWEAIMFFDVAIYVHNCMFHGAEASPYQLGCARLRRLSLFDTRCA